jgi:creatinine amidohydrolase/Fe(II)-dependent formamide hydrolase-like protein
MRLIGDLTSQEAASRLRETSILCLPLGSLEQHGPHLPLDTDAVLAGGLTSAIVERWGDAYDLWQLPTMPLGLSREHAWAAGTLSLSVQTMAALLRDVAGEIVRSLPARSLAVINGHGGNRGILEAVMREWQTDFGLNVCALHTGALMSPPAAEGVPEIHGGRDETSLMLALAPDLVRRDRIAALDKPPDAAAVRAVILDPGVSWPWSSGDPRIADQGVIGNPHAASAEIGTAIVGRVVEAAGVALQRLRDNQSRR